MWAMWAIDAIASLVTLDLGASCNSMQSFSRILMVPPWAKSKFNLAQGMTVSFCFCVRHCQTGANIMIASSSLAFAGCMDVVNFSLFLCCNFSKTTWSGTGFAPHLFNRGKLEPSPGKWIHDCNCWYVIVIFSSVHTMMLATPHFC